MDYALLTVIGPPIAATLFSTALVMQRWLIGRLQKQIEELQVELSQLKQQRGFSQVSPTNH